MDRSRRSRSRSWERRRQERSGSAERRRKEEQAAKAKEEEEVGALGRTCCCCLSRLCGWCSKGSRTSLCQCHHPYLPWSPPTLLLPSPTNTRTSSHACTAGRSKFCHCMKRATCSGSAHAAVGEGGGEAAGCTCVLNSQPRTHPPGGPHHDSPPPCRSQPFVPPPPPLSLTPRLPTRPLQDVEEFQRRVAAALEGREEEDEEEKLIQERRRRRQEILAKHREQQQLAGEGRWQGGCTATTPSLG